MAKDRKTVYVNDKPISIFSGGWSTTLRQCLRERPLPGGAAGWSRDPGWKRKSHWLGWFC